MTHIQHILNCKKVTTAIRRTRKHLIEVAKNEGFYENFGSREVGAISQKFINVSDYSSEMNQKRNEIANFNNWTKNVSLKDIQ